MKVQVKVGSIATPTGFKTLSVLPVSVPDFMFPDDAFWLNEFQLREYFIC